MLKTSRLINSQNLCCIMTIFFLKSTNTTQTPENYNTFFSLLGKILKFIWKYKRPWIIKVIFNNNKKSREKKNNAQNITALHPKLYYRPIATKKIVLVQGQPCSQEYRRESRNKPTWMQSSNLWQDVQIIHWGRGNSSSIYCTEETEYLYIEDWNQVSISNPADESRWKTLT